MGEFSRDRHRRVAAGVPLAAAVLLAGSAVLGGASTARAWESPVVPHCDVEKAKNGEELPWGHKWKTLPVPYYVWASSATGATPALDATEQQAIQGTQSAFTAWVNVESAAVTAEYAGTRTNTKLGDGKNDVLWIQTNWYDTTGVKSTDGEVLGLTFTQLDWQTGDSADNGCPYVTRCPDKEDPCPAAESDIFLNAEDLFAQPWPSIASGGSEPYAILVHEVGHFLGLGHSKALTPEPLMNRKPKIITGQPLLRPDDVEGISALYPIDAPLCDSDLDCISFNPCAVNCGKLSATYCQSVECARAERCVEGSCEDATGLLGSPCRTTADGPGCDTGLECKLEDGFYIGRCSGPCQNDEQCAPDGRCRELASGGDKECVFPGDLEDGAACSADGECKSAACVGNRCAESCETDCECEYGLACRAGACLEGRSTCYFTDGRKDNRTLNATLCAAWAPAGSPHPSTTGAMLVGVAFTLALRRRRRAR